VFFVCENARITAYTNKQYIYITNVCTVTEIDCKESTTKDKPRSGKIEQTCNPPVLASVAKKRLMFVAYTLFSINTLHECHFFKV